VNLFFILMFAQALENFWVRHCDGRGSCVRRASEGAPYERTPPLEREALGGGSGGPRIFA
jgi:hypothetical protein